MSFICLYNTKLLCFIHVIDVDIFVWLFLKSSHGEKDELLVFMNIHVATVIVHLCFFILFMCFFYIYLCLPFVDRKRVMVEWLRLQSPNHYDSGSIPYVPHSYFRDFYLFSIHSVFLLYLFVLVETHASQPPCSEFNILLSHFSFFFAFLHFFSFTSF